MSDNNSPSGLRKELKLSNMITMAAGGMIAAWMVEIKLWFELSGPGSVFALLTLAILILPLCFICLMQGGKIYGYQMHSAKIQDLLLFG